MEFIIGFVMGLTLTQVITYTLYKKSLDKIRLGYWYMYLKVKERLNEYNR